MNVRHIPQLATLLEQYFDAGELIDLARLYDVVFVIEEPWDEFHQGKQEWLFYARQIVRGTGTGNGHAFLDMLLEQLEFRNENATVTHTFERRIAHENLRPLVRTLRTAFDEEPAGSEIALPASTPFRAKSEIRDLAALATTDILVVDPYVGVATLDCLRDATTAVRILTGDGPRSIEAGFDRALRDFQAEGFTIEVRRARMLHDRHLLFNDRCWLIGSSLKDAGKKPFNLSEIIDTKAVVVADLEAKWSGGLPFP
jgi:hypothetical protein